MILTKNWKTTIAGFAQAVVICIIDGVLSGALTWKGILLGSLVQIKALLEKDYDSTGIGDKATKDPAKDATIAPKIAEIKGGVTIP